mmetsp:Transcript_40971/g.65890  ORF Transcript_40971/g.65890 Transcript_40971/m.65890 type:complete len:303 (+) Transcript_40971:86-994(+)
MKREPEPVTGAADREGHGGMKRRDESRQCLPEFYRPLRRDIIFKWKRESELGQRAIDDFHTVRPPGNDDNNSQDVPAGESSSNSPAVDQVTKTRQHPSTKGSNRDQVHASVEENQPEIDDSIFAPGDCVQIHGLKQTPQFNGRCGVIMKNLTNPASSPAAGLGAIPPHSKIWIHLIRDQFMGVGKYLEDFLDKRVRVFGRNLRRINDIRMVSPMFWGLYKRERSHGKVGRFYRVVGAPIAIRMTPNKSSWIVGWARPNDVVFRSEHYDQAILHLSGWIIEEDVAKLKQVKHLSSPFKTYGDG